MPLVQADKSGLCTHKFSWKILLKVNLRLRACLAMCLKYGRFQSKRAYNGVLIKKSVFIFLCCNVIIHVRSEDKSTQPQALTHKIQPAESSALSHGVNKPTLKLRLGEVRVVQVDVILFRISP